jgi:hypothetical protein
MTGHILQIYTRKIYQQPGFLPGKFFFLVGIATKAFFAPQNAQICS